MRSERSEGHISRQLQAGAAARDRAVRPIPQRPVPRFNIVTLFLWIIGLMIAVGVAQKVYKYIQPLL